LNGFGRVVLERRFNLTLSDRLGAGTVVREVPVFRGTKRGAGTGGVEGEGGGRRERRGERDGGGMGVDPWPGVLRDDRIQSIYDPFRTRVDSPFALRTAHRLISKLESEDKTKPLTLSTHEIRGVEGRESREAH